VTPRSWRSWPAPGCAPNSARWPGAFTGFFTDQHAFLLAKMLTRVDALDADLAELDAELAELIAPLVHTIDRLDEVPGLGQTAACLLIAELGTDMTRFPTAGHLVSWAKYVPGVSESAGNARAADRPGTATRIWLGCSVRPLSPPARPIPSFNPSSMANTAKGWRRRWPGRPDQGGRGRRCRRSRPRCRSQPAASHSPRPWRRGGRG
jgi:hypothetical protein